MTLLLGVCTISYLAKQKNLNSEENYITARDLLQEVKIVVLY